MQRFHALIKDVDAVMIAPGATSAERMLGYGSGVLGATFAVIVCAWQGSSSLTVTVLVIVGFDLFGGAVVNATPSGSRRFHESDRSKRSVIGFVAAHVHMLVLAALLPEMPWMTAVTTYIGILLASILIVFVPDAYRQPTAFMLTAFLVAVCAVVQPMSTVRVIHNHGDRLRLPRSENTCLVL